MSQSLDDHTTASHPLAVAGSDASSDRHRRSRQHEGSDAQCHSGRPTRHGEREPAPPCPRVENCRRTNTETKAVPRRRPPGTMRMPEPLWYLSLDGDRSQPCGRRFLVGREIEPNDRDTNDQRRHPSGSHGDRRCPRSRQQPDRNVGQQTGEHENKTEERKRRPSHGRTEGLGDRSPSR